MSFSVRPVLGDDWQRLRETRLRSLATDPEAFGSTYDQIRSRPDSEWHAQADASEQGLRSRWFAAADQLGDWLGIALAHGGEQAVDADLFGMWVAPRARGTGVAAALCQACSDWAVQRGYPSIVLGVVAANRRAFRAYRKLGFVEYQRVAEQYGDRVLDLILMRRDLSSESLRQNVRGPHERASRD